MVCSMNLLITCVVSTSSRYMVRQTRRKICKLQANIDEKVLHMLENEQIKPRRHPGIVQLKYVELPTNIAKALSVIVADYPIKTLLKDGEKLNNYFYSRHPPQEAEANYKLFKKNVEITERLIPLPGKFAELSDDEKEKWQERRLNILKKRMSKQTYVWKPMKYDNYESIVYAISRGPREYSVLLRIMHEIAIRDRDFKPNSYFDFGSGVGTGMWASSTIWMDSIHEYFNVDSSSEMNDLSELILRNGNINEHMSLRNVFYRQFLPHLETKYDLVVSSYSLFELPSLEARKETILNLWKKCDGYMIIVEEGTRRGFELIHEARKLILSINDPQHLAHVHSPCPHNTSCPRFDHGKYSKCHFESTYIQSATNKINKHAKALYSYIVLKKGIQKHYDSDVTSNNWPRIISPTLTRCRHTICRMCTAEGKLHEIIFTKSKHGKLAYRCAKASNWGDRLPICIEETQETNAK